MSEQSRDVDVASRLAQGRAAVDDAQNYVWACHQLGFTHPDLTTHAAQLRDWYGTEDGLDLAALHRDCAALDDAARAAEDALSVQDRQLARLSAAWHGAGGDSAVEFLRRHGHASAAVATTVRAAVRALTMLREDLWRAVGVKADAAVAVEERSTGSRAPWTAAAATVLTGVGDRAAASELLDQQVRPFVENAVATQWLDATRRAVADVSAAYQRSVADIDTGHLPVFDIPGDLGPWAPSPSATHGHPGGCSADAEPACVGGVRGALETAQVLDVTAPVAARVTPAAFDAATAGPGAGAAPPLPAPLPAPPTAGSPPGPASPLPASPLESMSPGMGAGLPGVPGLGGGLTGLGQPFADLLSGLLGGSASELSDLRDPQDLDEPDPLKLDDGDLDAPEPEQSASDRDGPEGVEELGGPDEPGDAGEAVDGEPDPQETPSAVQPVDAPPGAEPCAGTDGDAEAVSAPTPPPTPPPAPPPAEPIPPVEATAGDRTPCEIAADEVPQVGEPPG